MVSNINKIAESNAYEHLVDTPDLQYKKDMEDFKNYYENATEEEKAALDNQFKTYLDEELQKEAELKNKLRDSEIKESSEISEQDIADLNTIRNLTDVLNNYPNISSPEHRAIKKMVDEYVKDLSRATQEVLSNPEDQEWDDVDEHN